MEIMSAPFSTFTRVGTFVGGLVLASGLQLFAGEVVSLGQQSPIYARNVARVNLGARVEAFHSNPSTSLQLSSKSEDSVAQVALISDHPTAGYTLPDGSTDLVLSLSKIENFDVVSFLNDGATGTVTIATSNSRLVATSPQWHQIAKQDLTAKITKIKVGPTEAKYVRFTFNVADLAVYSTVKLTIANTALAGGGEATVDGKDAKDFGGGKEAKEVAEAPEEGPPPNLPDPPPFVFVPILSP